MTAGAEQQLGEVIRRYETNNGRRGRLAVIAVLTGISIGGLGVVMLIIVDDSPQIAAGAIPSVIIGIGLGLLLVGIWLGWLFLTRSGEAFTVHEGGLVHAYAERSRAITWGEIAEVVDQGKDTVPARVLGGDVSCRIKLNNGGRALVITGHTRDAGHLVETVRQAALHDVRPTPPHGTT
jgi:hypothetical protein